MAGCRIYQEGTDRGRLMMHSSPLPMLVSGASRFHQAAFGDEREWGCRLVMVGQGASQKLFLLNGVNG